MGIVTFSRVYCLLAPSHSLDEHGDGESESDPHDPPVPLHPVGAALHEQGTMHHELRHGGRRRRHGRGVGGQRRGVILGAREIHDHDPHQLPDPHPPEMDAVVGIERDCHGRMEKPPRVEKPVAQFREDA